MFSKKAARRRQSRLSLKKVSMWHSSTSVAAVWSAAD